MNIFLASLKRLNWRIILTFSCNEKYVLDNEKYVLDNEKYVLDSIFFSEFFDIHFIIQTKTFLKS